MAMHQEVIPVPIRPQLEDSTLIRPVGHRGTNVRVNAQFDFTSSGFDIRVLYGPHLANSQVYFPLVRRQVLSRIGLRGITYIKMESHTSRMTIHCQGHRVVTLLLNDAEKYQEFLDTITRDESFFFRVQESTYDQYISNEKIGQIKSAFGLMNRTLPSFYVGLDYLEHAAFGCPTREISIEEAINQEVAMDLVKDYQELIRIMSGHLDHLQIQHDRNVDDSVLGNFRFNRRVQKYNVKPEDGALERPMVWREERSSGGILSSLFRGLVPCVAVPENEEPEKEELIAPKKELRISGPFFPRKVLGI